MRRLPVLGFPALARSALVVPSVVVAVLAGCSGLAAHTRPHRTSLLDGIAAAPTFESPARWQYHPRAIGAPVTQVLTTDRGQLVLAGAGERWWADDKAVLAADELAPAQLVGAVNNGAQGWLFVDETGATYTTATPLGKFTRATSPPEPLVRVAASSKLLLGVTRAGGLLASGDGGANWRPLPVPARVADVALVASGEGLVLGVPERLFTLRDFGASLEPAALDAFGALALEARADSIAVRAILKSQLYTPGKAQPWSELEAEPERELSRAEVPIYEDAAALNAGRALRTLSHSYEIQSSGSNVSLLTGPLGGKLTRRSVAIEGTCPYARLAGDDVALFLMCSESPGGRIDALRFLRSTDAGRSFRDEGFTTRGDLDRLSTATFGAGELLVVGVCPVEAAGPGCRPQGVHVRVQPPAVDSRQPPALLRPLPIAGLGAFPLALVQGVQPGALVVVGKRAKSDELAVYTTLDAGRSFESDVVPELRLIQTEARLDGASLSVVNARTGQDGYTGIVVYDRVSADRSIVSLDERGKVVNLTRAPSEFATVAVNGLFGLALDVRSGEAWESVDGGAGWQPIGQSPVSFCNTENPRDRCDVELFCHDQGCAVGDRLSRVGWRGQVSGAFTALPPPAVQSPEPAAVAIRTPIVCSFEGDQDWQRVSGGVAPDATRAGLGDVQWFSYVDDYRDASVKTYEAVNGKVRSEVLFAADPQPASAAMYVSLQVEGVVALRFQKGQPIEVAWRNLFESGETHRAKLPADVTLESVPTRHNARLAAPDLITITSGGVFVRAAADETRHASYFLPSKGPVERIPPFDWAPKNPEARNELVRVDGQTLGLWFMGNGTGIVSASRTATGWSLHAAATGLLDPKAFGARQRHDIVYTGSVPAFGVSLTDTTASSAWVFPLHASGPALGAAIGVATQSRLPAEPRGCTAEERRLTPRVLASSERGTRHPVLVTHAAEPIRTLVTDAVAVYGSEREPCVDVFDAETVESSRSEALSALVRVESSATSWLFRRVAGAEELEYRPMRCQLDAAAEVPPEVYKFLLKNP